MGASGTNENPDFGITLRLIRSAQDGNEAALGKLCERYEGRILSRVRRMLGGEVRTFAQSMDLVQELFVDLIREFDRFEMRDENAFLRWATQIARNNIRDLVRRLRIRRMERLATSVLLPGRPDGDDPADPAVQAAQKDQLRQLESALGELPPDYRTVIRFRDIEGLSFADVADRMGRPSEAAAQMLHARALARLTRLIDPGSPTGAP